jgi:hypothetical protein
LDFFSFPGFDLTKNVRVAEQLLNFPPGGDRTCLTTTSERTPGAGAPVRSRDPAISGDAKVIRKFGEVPEDLSAL